MRLGAPPRPYSPRTELVEYMYIKACLFYGERERERQKHRIFGEPELVLFSGRDKRYLARSRHVYLAHFGFPDRENF